MIISKATIEPLLKKFWGKNVKTQYSEFDSETNFMNNKYNSNTPADRFLITASDQKLLAIGCLGRSTKVDF